jgi:hypothetical protein
MITLTSRDYRPGLLSDPLNSACSPIEIARYMKARQIYLSDGLFLANILHDGLAAFYLASFAVRSTSTDSAVGRSDSTI